MSNKNRWKEIWSKKTLISDGHQDIEDLFIQMKIADGYDALGNLKITYLDFKAQFDVYTLSFRKLLQWKIYQCSKCV